MVYQDDEMTAHFINIKFFLSTLLCLMVICNASITTFGQNTSTRGSTEEANTHKTNGTQYALVVGISKYHNIAPLLYADDDAQSFRDFLVDTKMASEANIHMLIDSTATRSRFYAEIKKIMDKLKENDRVIIYFAGHGDVDNDIDAGFLLGYNCEATPYAASDAIDIAMLERYVDAITKKKVKVLLISDACRSGKLTGGAHGAELTLTALSSRFKNTVKILSCGPGELSEEKNFRDGGHGIFTYYLLQALYGLCDEDNNNVITKKEVDKYLRDKVSSATGNRQNPIIEGSANEVISDVIPELKQAMLAKVQHSEKENNKPLAKRTVAEKNTAGVSAPDSLLIKKFYTQLRDGKLNSPAEDNAYATFEMAKKTITSTEVINAMKYDLAAALEDDVQPLLNRLTRGEFQETPYKLYDSASQKLELIKNHLLTKEDYRYNDIVALQIYFNQAGISTDEALKDLLVADSLHPNTAYINCEIGRYYTRKSIPDSVRAFRYFRKAISLAPTWPFPHLMEGLLYLELEMHSNAKKSFEKALSLKPDFKFALINLGVVFNRLKEYNKEISYYRQASEIAKPNTIVLYNNIGLYWKSEGVYDSALYYYKKGYSIDTMNIANLAGIINSFIKLNKKDSGRVYLSRIENARPMTIEDYTAMGDGFYDYGQYDKAIQYYNQAIKIKPTAYAYNNVGNSYEKLNKKSHALPYYNLALANDPNNFFAMKALAKYFQAQQQTDSANFYIKMMEGLHNDDATSLQYIAEVYLNEDNYDKSLEYNFKALAKKPNAYIYNNIGLAYEKTGRDDEAKKYYLLAVQKDPDFSVPIKNLAIWYYQHALYDSAAFYYKILLAINTSAENYNSLAEVFYMKSKFDSAILYYHQAVALDKSRPHYFVNLGHSYFYSGKIAESIQFYEKALSTDSSYTVVYPKLALAYFTTHKYQQSIVFYNKFLSRDTSEQRVVYYVISVANCKIGKPGEALTAFENSLQSGYRDLFSLSNDFNLDCIRTLPAYKKLVEAYFKKEEIEKYPKLFERR